MDIQNVNNSSLFPIMDQWFSIYPPSDVSFRHEMGRDALGDGSLGRSMVIQSNRFSKDVLNLYFKGSIPSAAIVNDKEFIQILNSIHPEMLTRAADSTSAILGGLEDSAVKEKLMPFTTISSEMVNRTKTIKYPIFDSIIYNKHYGLKDLVEKTDVETFGKISDETLYALSKEKRVLTSPEHIKSRVEYFSTQEYQELLNLLKEKTETGTDSFESVLQTKLITTTTDPKEVMEYIKDFDIERLKEIAPRVSYFRPQQILEFLFYHSEKKTELIEENLKYSGHLSHDTEKELVDLTGVSKILSRYPNTNRRVGHLPAAWMEGIPKEQQKEFTEKIYSALQSFSNTRRGYDDYQKLSKELEQLFGQKTQVIKVGSGAYGVVTKITVGNRQPFALKTFYLNNPITANIHGAAIEPQNAMFAKGRTNNFPEFYFGQVADIVDCDGFMVLEFLSDDAPKEQGNHFSIDRLSSADSIKSMGHNYLGGKICDYGLMYASDKELLENESIARYVRIITDNLVKPKGGFFYEFNDKRLEIVKSVIQSSKTPQDVQKAIEIIEKYGAGKIGQRSIYQLKQIMEQ